MNNLNQNLTLFAGAGNRSDHRRGEIYRDKTSVTI